MSREQVGILIVHGIGRQTAGYSEIFQKNLLKQTKSTRLQPVFEEVVWQRQLDQSADDLVERCKPIGWLKTRKIAASFAGDALAYHPVEGKGSYSLIHKEVDKGFRHLSIKLHRESPLCIVGHSLGSIILGNFMWDCTHPDSMGLHSFRPTPRAKEMSDRVKLMVTMGSPKAIWSLEYENGGVPPTLSDDAKWLNIFSPYDLVGYPVKSINDVYNLDPSIEDLSMKVGPFPRRWTPACHIDYFDDPKVAKAVVRGLLCL